MLPIHLLVYRLRFVISGILVTLAALLLICAAVPQNSGIVQAKSVKPSPDMAAMGVTDSPNAVANAMTLGAYQLRHHTEAGLRATANGLRSFAAAVSHTSAIVGHSIQTGVTTAAGGVGNSILFVVRIPGHIFGAFTGASVVNAVIKPADHSPVPIIDPRSPALNAAVTALPATQPATQLPTEAVWPLHGLVTTEFGVPEWPYQAVHTGLDISDGKPSGTSPITAFRRGTVIAAGWGSGLGNHVVIDHANGVTSVYGHLSSITVQAGQNVTVHTVLGYEGSTGVSTGPHLHFEIRVDGQATNPQQFISGRP